MELVMVAVALAAGLAGGLGVARWRRGANPGDAGDQVALSDVERLTAVMDGLHSGVVLCDADGRIAYRNRAARSLTGTHAGILVDETIERHLRQALGGATSEELIELYGPPKMMFIVRAERISTGGAYAFVDDISERRRIDAVRTDFVANISHELKTPVGALAVLAETLVDEEDPVVVHRIADRLLEESHRAARTIDDLLELSQIELGGEQVHDRIEARQVVRSAVERAEPLAEPHGIAIMTLDGDALTVHGDRRQLVSAVGNLVENAVKYSEPGSQVQIRARREGGWIEFMVADQGVGIPSRDLDRIFERFYRVDKARSRRTGGSGLGLAIVRHVATNHGGEVLVSSREGEGSTFVLRVPIGADETSGSAAVSSRDTRGPVRVSSDSPADLATPERGAI